MMEDQVIKLDIILLGLIFLNNKMSWCFHRGYADGGERMHQNVQGDPEDFCNLATSIIFHYGQPAPYFIYDR